MPLAYTVFEVRENVSAEEILEKLSKFSLMKGSLEVFGQKYSLGVRVTDLESFEGGVSGKYEEVAPYTLPVNEETIKVPRVLRLGFHFTWVRGGIFLLVASGKRKSLRVSSTLSEVIFGKPDLISPVYIPPQRLRELYSEGAEPRQVVFTGLREVAGVDTVALYGKLLAQSSLLKRYMQVGQERYVVYRDERGLFGVSAGGLIIAFSRIEDEEFRSYIVERILPKVEPVPI